MSNVLMVCGHPNLNESVSNQGIISEFTRLCPQAEVRCLDRLYPDWKFDIAAEQQALRAADVIILEFPLYWYSVPALLKKWYEEVMAHGFALGSTGTALHGKRLLVSVTVGAPGEAYRQDGAMGHTVKEFLLPLLQSARLCGMEVLEPVCSTGMMFVPGVSTAADRERLEGLAREHAQRLCGAVARALGGGRMTVKAVRLYEQGFMTEPFAKGGEEGEDRFDPRVRYRSSLQNYVIDTGSEVILIDTGTPAEYPGMVPTPDSKIYIGSRVEDYVSALRTAGYTPEQVTKVVVTHKHEDHTGELRSFPNAKIYIGKADADALGLEGPNIVRATFSDGPYHNFPRSQVIAEGVRMVEAVGHTLGNSLIIAEDGGLFYMFHGDVTYTDEALYENKLSIVYEDRARARETLDRVRDFVRANPTVYLSTHTPLGIENLEALRVVDLEVPVESQPVGDVAFKTASGKYACAVCGYIYDPDQGDASQGVPPGTAFADLPEGWACPLCHQGKDKFSPA
ncbi:MAG: NAD(P)H-dependent oxidoreductase [Succinivibrionaceae bacterium]|nr:NAD(P)H-dependent oxidoreductase [Succinivibrionaceae bacterium]